MVVVRDILIGQEVVTPNEIVTVVERLAEDAQILPSEQIQHYLRSVFSSSPPNAEQLERLVQALEKGKNKMTEGRDKIAWVLVSRFLIQEGWVTD